MTTMAVRALNAPEPDEVVYPESDGQPMADNDLQFEWITTLKWNLEDMLRDNPEVYVAGDMLWYPVEGNPRIRVAPDAFVIFGRPKGYRGSYRQWDEAGIAPQVVFEVLSPGNRAGEMTRKYNFYDRYGVEEYYLLDPDDQQLDAWIRSSDSGRLEPVPPFQVFTSPRLGVRFEVSNEEVTLYRANGERFQTYMEALEAARQAQSVAEQAQEAQKVAEARAEAEAVRADAETARAERLAARLRELGIEAE